jgi:Uma2 family endonuclease
MVLTAQQFEAQMPDAQLLLSDEPEMESSLHYAQLALLVSCLEWLWRDAPDSDHSPDFFIGANLTIYFSRQQLKNKDFRGPDFFLVKDTPNQPRPSWVVWEEDGRYPNVIVELLSESTAQVDRTIKKQLYQDRFRTPEYFWFSPSTLEFEGYRLLNGVYDAIESDAKGWRWSEQLQLFLGIEAQQLRYFTPEGELVPTPAEAAQQATAQAQQATAQAQQATAQAQRWAAKLRELGVDPDSLPD